MVKIIEILKYPNKYFFYNLNFVFYAIQTTKYIKPKIYISGKHFITQISIR